MAEKPDPELDELLDAAAKDFKKSEEPSTSNSDSGKSLQPDDFDSEIAKELQRSMQESLAAACEDQGFSPDEISNQLKNLKLFGESSAMDADKGKEFSDAIMGAMQSLRENLSEAFPAARDGEEGDGDDASGNEMESLTNVMQQMMLALLSKEMLLPSFKEMSEKLSLPDCDAELQEFSNVMRNVMKSLLSKEMMLPSFKELAGKYPGWLEENKSKLSEADLKRYTEQLEIVQQIVSELEKEGSEDDKQHLERMVELMGKAQELGQPPPDLTAQLGNAIDDSKIDAMLKDSGADQCNIM